MSTNDTLTGFGADGVLSRTVFPDPFDGIASYVDPVTVDTHVRVVWTPESVRVYSDHWPTTTIGNSLLECDWFDTLRPLVVAPTGPVPSATDGLIASLKAESGLTWEQIARALGVSKRTVLLWAGGARLSNKNHELVLSLKELVDGVDGSPDERRNILLTPGATAPSPLTVWVQTRAAGEERVNAPVLAAHELMG